MIFKLRLSAVAVAMLMISSQVMASVDTTAFYLPGQSEDAELQAALTYCSDHGETCVIPANKMYTITTDLFIWGGASLVGAGQNSGILFKPNDASRPLLQVGLAPQNMVYHATTPYIPKPIFTGKIKDLTLKIDSSITREYLDTIDAANPEVSPNLIYRPKKLVVLWRTDGAEISNNTVDVANSKYGFTGSNNNANYVPAGTSTPGAWVGTYPVRKNIRILNNKLSSGDHLWTKSGKNSDGNEGIALSLFDGAYIAHNTIAGFGDDVIAFHYGKNAIIEQNYGASVDGRIYVSGSYCVAVLYNDLARLPTTLYKATGPDEFPNGWGVSLLTLDGESRSAPVTQTIVHGNKLFVPAGLREDGMRFDGVRAAQISRNSLFQPADANMYGPVAGAALPLKTGLRLERLNHSTIIPNYSVPQCFQGTNLSLPNNMNFISLVGDNYTNAISSYMPSKNVLLEDNNFAPTPNGPFTSAAIAMVEHPTVAAWSNREPSEELLGNVSQASSCNESTLVGTSTCHSIAVISNRARALPWQVCNQTQFSNLPGAGVTLDPLNCLYYQNAQADFNSGNLLRLQSASVSDLERIHYSGNATDFDGSNSTPLSSFTIPGVIPSEYFHDAYSSAPVALPADKKCRNPFGKNLNSVVTTDFIGECDLKGVLNQWVEYNVDVLESGVYSINFRAKGIASAKFQVIIDNQTPILVGVPNGGYGDYRIQGTQLGQGIHKVRIKFIGGATHLNYFKFEINR